MQIFTHVIYQLCIQSRNFRAKKSDFAIPYKLMLIKMSLSLPDRALLVKLYYQNDNSAVVALRKFRTFKGMRKGPMNARNL